MTRRGCPARPPRQVEDVSALDAEISALIRHARHAPRTLSLAETEQDKFAAWVHRQCRGLPAMPAAPIVLASYLAWMSRPDHDAEGRVLRAAYALSTIRTARTGVGLAHRCAGLPDPAADPYVQGVVRGIARSYGIARPQQQDPLTHDLLLRLLTVPAPLPEVTSLRDRAAVLVSAVTGLSLAALSAQPRTGLIFGPAGAVLRAAGGQHALTCRCTAREGSLLCPVAALRDLDADLPAQAELLLGVVHAERGGGTRPLAYPEPGEAARVARAVQAAIRCAGSQWPAAAAVSSPSPAALAQLLGRLDPASTRWVRDNAVLLVGWHLALRGGEVGSLSLADLRRDRSGYTAMLGRTKGDQVGAGSPLSLLPTRGPALDPVAAMDAWLLRRGPEPGPVFTSLRGGHPRPGRAMSTASVGTVIRDRTAAAGLAGRFSSHSLRIGFVVSGVQLGASIPDLMTVTRHRDPQMVGYYARGQLGRPDPGVLTEVLGWTEAAA